MTAKRREFTSPQEEIDFLKELLRDMYHAFIEDLRTTPNPEISKRRLNILDLNLRHVGILPMTEQASAEIERQEIEIGNK